MSVFRYGLVGPNFQPNLLSERAEHLPGFGWGAMFRARGKKGKMVNIPLLPTAGDFKGGDTVWGSVFWLIVELNKLFVFF